MTQKIITLDPGHQSAPNSDTGCQGFGLREEDIVLDICKRAKTLIELNGIKVIMTRDGAKVNGDGSSLNASLNTRCQIANSNKTDLFLSVHCDAFNSQAFGTTCHVFGLNGNAEKFSKILSPMMEQLFYNRGIKVSNFAVLRLTNMPAILLETAFLDNKDDNTKLADSNIRQQIAENIAKSVCIYFGINYVCKEQTQQFYNVPITPSVPSRSQISISTIPIITSKFSYLNNAKIINDDLYIRDSNGNKISGRYVSNGDNVTILDVDYFKQLILLEYPTSNGVRNGYVSNVTNCLQYYHLNQWKNGSTKEIVYDKNGNVLGSLDSRESATPLYRKNGKLHVVYSTGKGVNSKSGFVSWNGGFNKF